MFGIFNIWFVMFLIDTFYSFKFFGKVFFLYYRFGRKYNVIKIYVFIFEVTQSIRYVFSKVFY